MKDKTYDLGYYNPIHREVLDLIRDTTDKAIFDKAWHEFTARVRGGKSLYFSMKAREVGRQTEIGHSIISSHIKGMVQMGILIDDGESYTVAGDYVLSLLNAYRQLKTYEERKEFKTAISRHDVKRLEEMGYVFYDGITSELKFLSGKTGDGCNNTQVASIQSTWLESEPVGYDNGQLAIIRASWIGKIREYITKNFTLAQIIATSTEIIGSDSSQLAIIRATQEVFSDNEKLSPDAETILITLAGSVLSEIGYDSSHPLAMIRARGGYDSSHSKYNKEDDNKKNEGMPSASYIEGENDLKEKIDENLPGEEFKRVDMAGYSQVKHKNSLPYYSTSQVREITANPEEAVTASDKLFIYLMWEILSDQTYKVEDGEESDDKVESSQFPVQGFKSTVLRTAYGSMCDAIEDGMFETKSGQEFPVDKNLEPITWEQALLIPGFETISTEQEDYYIITSAKIHNIFGEPVEPVKGKQHRRRSEEERERENEYFHQLILCRNDDDKYQELTNAEAAVIIFMDEHFQVDYEKGEVTGLKKEFMKIDGNYVNSMELTRYINIVQNEVDRAFTLADFLSLLTNGKPGLDGSLNISERMFSYDNIQFWNQKHGETSPIKL